jgi:hypothetical protein
VLSICGFGKFAFIIPLYKGIMEKLKNSFTSVVRIVFTNQLLVWLCACKGYMVF